MNGGAKRMRSTIERDLSRLLPQVEPFLVNRRLENTSVITNLYFWLTDETPKVEKTGAYVRDAGGEPAGVAVNHEGWRVVLSTMSEDAAAALEESLAGIDLDIAEVVGPPGPAAWFAGRRGARLGRPWRPGSRIGMYLAGDRPMPGCPGAARPIGEDDLPLVTEWLGVFYPGGRPWRATARARNLVHHGDAFLWEADGRPVAFAACTGALWGVAQAGPIYTPPEHRGTRYAMAAARRAIAGARERGADVITTWINLDNPPAKWKRARVELIDEVHRYIR